jgi:hypothetical protein
MACIGRPSTYGEALLESRENRRSSDVVVGRAPPAGMSERRCAASGLDEIPV